MYLVSCPAHGPLAVFDQWINAENYLCSLASIPIGFTCIRQISDSTMFELYTEDNGPHPGKILGYITEGVQINPQEFLDLNCQM